MIRYLILSLLLSTATPALAQQEIDLHPGESVSVRDFNQLKYKVGELERKMSGRDGKGGVQQQITILHSELQQTRDQIAHCLRLLRAKSHITIEHVDGLDKRLREQQLKLADVVATSNHCEGEIAKIVEVREKLEAALDDLRSIKARLEQQLRGFVDQ